jgi:hypothetical protein
VPAAKRPVDELRAIAAPNELIEWVRKFPPESAARSTWVDAPRADWLPYLAVLRGISRDAILKAVCECAVELAEKTPDSPERGRAIAVLRDGTTRGKDAFTTAEAELADLRLQIIEHQARATSAPWIVWIELVLELARANARGNPLVGIALALRTLATKTTAKGRPAHMDLVARLRDKLTLAM